MKCYVVIKCDLAARVSNPWQLGSLGAALDYIARQYGVRKLADGGDHVVYGLADMFGRQEIDYIKVLVHFNRTAGCEIECLPVQSRHEYYLFLLPLAGQDHNTFGRYVESLMVENLIRSSSVQIYSAWTSISTEMDPKVLIRLARESGYNRIYAGEKGCAIVVHTESEKQEFIQKLIDVVGLHKETVH